MLYESIIFSFFVCLTIRLVMNDYMPRTSFQLAGPSRDVVALRHQFPHQHMQPVVAEGPTHFPNFRNRVWTFHVQGVDMRLSMHQSDPPTVQRAVVSELEKLFLSALNQCVRDGANTDDLVHIYLDCAGLEYRFQFNPTGPHAVTLGKCICLLIVCLVFSEKNYYFLLQELCFLVMGCIPF